MFSAFGFSKSKASSDQSASIYLTQQFSGACNIVCENTMNNVSIDLINTTVEGDVSVTQSCSTNGSCMIGSTMDSTMDVLFKAADSSGAQDAANGMASFGNMDISSSKSRQNIRLSSYQNTNENCNIGSYNQMSNVTIFAANSTIGGSVDISQGATTGGNCALSNTMSSAASATGLSDNISTSGKQKGGFIHIIIILAVLLIAFFIAKSIAGNSQSNEQERQNMENAMARAQAGCPGGQKPIVNPATGLPYIDTKTWRPICPYPNFNQGGPTHPTPSTNPISPTPSTNPISPPK